MSLKQIFEKKYEYKTKRITNSKARPNGVDGIIIHSMAEYLGNPCTHAVEFLQTMGLSAHYMIEPDGSVIECVDPDKQAYHAGVSKFNGKTNLNKTFIGIEILVEGHHTYASFLEAIKDSDTFTMKQYDSTAVLCALLMDEYPDITFDSIVRHSDVSGEEVRPHDPKHDVGEGFDWELFMDHVKAFHDQLMTGNSTISK